MSWLDDIKGRLGNLFVIMFILAFIETNWKTLLFIFKESDASRTVEYLNEYPFQWPIYSFFIVFGAYLLSIFAAKGLENIVKWVKSFTEYIEYTTVAESAKLRLKIRSLNGTIRTKENDISNTVESIKIAVYSIYKTMQMIPPSTHLQDLIITKKPFDTGILFYSNDNKEFESGPLEQISGIKNFNFYFSIYSDSTYTVGIRLDTNNPQGKWINSRFLRLPDASAKDYYYTQGHWMPDAPSENARFIRIKKSADEQVTYYFSHSFFSRLD